MHITLDFYNLDELIEFARLILYSPSLRKPGSETCTCQSHESGVCGMAHEESGISNMRELLEKLAPEEEKKPKTTKNPDCKKRLDTGKIIALYKAGWDAKKIANEIGCSVQSVYNTIKPYKKNEEDTER